MTTPVLSDVEQAFADDGMLSRAMPTFRARVQQREMACAVAQAICEQQVLVVEAGTGTGKTYAYLVPALLSAGKVIVSTGTRTLQDQLFRRDLPELRAALKLPVTLALLKGRSNYVCPYHLGRNATEGRFLSPHDVADLREIVRFANVTHSGDKAECGGVREDSPAWLAATSTRDNCLGQDCPEIGKCFVMAARRAAMEADLVVVNHHLFFADVVLRDEELGELLPECQTIIFDEAHQLPETASMFFGESLSTAQMIELARDIRAEAAVAAGDCRELFDGTRALEKASRELRLVFDADASLRLAASRLRDWPGFEAALQELQRVLSAFEAILATQAERSEGLVNCLQRAQSLALCLQRWQDVGSQGKMIQWLEVFSQSLVLHATPLCIGEIFQRQLTEQSRSWVFTSGTLALREDFSLYCAELGLNNLPTPVRTRVWGSPFDYASQALLYAPQGLPDPNHPNYSMAVAEMALPLIRAAKGRTFVLCTSLRAMRQIHAFLAEKLAGDTLLSLLLQGESSRSELLERFRKLGNAVLVASQSFWEGVDVPGDALSLVIIDKLPFAPPDDPVLAARTEDLRRRGQNPFAHYQLPRAVISIKQGAGRLIRHENDCGVLCICDPRMLTKSYGKVVWRSLPPMRRTREAAEVIQFLGQL